MVRGRNTKRVTPHAEGNRQPVALTLIFGPYEGRVILGGRHAADDARALLSRVMEQRTAGFDYVRQGPRGLSDCERVKAVDAPSRD